MATVYVGNLPPEVQESMLRNLFSDYGPVESIALVSEGALLRAKSFCLLELSSRNRASSAAERLNGQYFRGRLLHVEYRSWNGSAVTAGPAESGASLRIRPGSASAGAR